MFNAKTYAVELMPKHMHIFQMRGKNERFDYMFCRISDQLGGFIICFGYRQLMLAKMNGRAL